MAEAAGGRRIRPIGWIGWIGWCRGSRILSHPILNLLPGGTFPVMDPRRRRWRRRGLVYGLLLGAFWGFWVWQPWEYDLVPRKPETPLPMMDPESASLFAQGTRVLVVTAHPDDPEFYLGGLLVKVRDAGADVLLAVMTDGDKGYYPFEDWKRNRLIRREEQRAATSRWSKHEPVFLGFDDGRLRDGERERSALLKVANSFRPQYVLGFDFDYPPRMSHRDHRRAGAITEWVAPRTRARWLLRFSTVAENYVVDVTDQWDEHKSLVAEHKSQFSGERLEGVQNMIASMLEEYGLRIDATLGVGMRCTRLKD